MNGPNASASDVPVDADGPAEQTATNAPSDSNDENSHSWSEQDELTRREERQRPYASSTYIRQLLHPISSESSSTHSQTRSGVPNGKHGRDERDEEDARGLLHASSIKACAREPTTDVGSLFTDEDGAEISNEKEIRHSVCDDTRSAFVPPRTAFSPPPYSSEPVPSAEDFHRFYWKCMSLKSELIRLDFSLRSVAASGLGIQAVHDFRTSLHHLRDLYGINTAVLYPEDINVGSYKPTNSKLHQKRFSICFKNFANALTATAKALYVFSDVYHDETLTTQLFVLQKRFMSEGLKLDGDILRMDPYIAKIRVQCFLREWVELAIESLLDPVRHFHEKGIVKIGQAQKTKSSRYFDMTTIATFFSAVTASMIQTTASDVRTATGVAANTFFFSSLVFSIGSAVNSLLVMSWRRSVVHEPDRKLAWWFKAWLNIGPMVSLIISGIFFVAGLCLSAFSTSQHVVTSVVTIGFSGLHACTLFVLAYLHLRAKWTFRQNAGHIGKDLTRDSVVLVILDWMSDFLNPTRDEQDQRTSSGSRLDMSISQTEEGTMSPSFKSSKDLLHDLLSGKKDAYDSSAPEWNALADEDFFLPSTYIKGEYSRRPPLRDETITPKGSSWNPVAQNIGLQYHSVMESDARPRVSTDTAARSDQDLRDHRGRPRNSSVEAIHYYSKNSRSRERYLRNRNRSTSSIGESATGRRSNGTGRSGGRRQRMRSKKRSTGSLKPKIGSSESLADVIIEEDFEDLYDEAELRHTYPGETVVGRAPESLSRTHSQDPLCLSSVHTAAMTERCRTSSLYSTTSKSPVRRRFSFERSTRTRRGQAPENDRESFMTRSEADSDASSTSEAVRRRRLYDNFEAFLNIAERMAEVHPALAKKSGVHAAASFLPSSDIPSSNNVRAEGYREPDEVGAVPSRYERPPSRLESTDSLATSVEANMDFRQRRRSKAPVRQLRERSRKLVNREATQIPTRRDSGSRTEPRIARNNQE